MGRLHPLADVRVAPGSVRQALADWDLDAALVRARLPAAGPRRRRPFDEAWCREHFPERNTAPAARSHPRIYEVLEAMAAQDGGGVVVVGGYREGGKTTICRDEYVLWRLAELPERTAFVVLGGRTADKGKEGIAAIKDALEVNPRLAASYPDLCGRGPEWSVGTIRTRRRQLVAAIGSQTHVRGTLRGGVRPALVAVDDPDDLETVWSMTDREHMWMWVTQVVLSLGTSRSDLVMPGNVLHPQGVMSRGLQETTWRWRLRLPAVLSWSGSLLWRQWEAMLAEVAARGSEELAHEAAMGFLHGNRDEMLEGAEVDWPEVWPYERLMLRRHQMGAAAFDAEFQAEPRTTEDSPFETPHFWHGQDGPGPCEPGELLTVVGVDPHHGAEDGRGSFTAICALCRESSGRRRVAEYRQGRWRPEIMVAHIADMAEGREEGEGAPQAWTTAAVAIEAEGGQGFLVEMVRAELAARKLSVPVIPMHVPAEGGRKVSKDARVWRLGPAFNAGLLLFGPGQRDLVEQFVYYGSRDVPKDGPDCVEIAWRALDRLAPGSGEGAGGVRVEHVRRAQPQPRWRDGA